MKLSYEYPATPASASAPATYRTALLKPIRLKKEPYEAVIESQGLSFHIIFGSQINGNFLCIPNWALGCELAEYTNKSWNRTSILNTKSGLDHEDAAAIAYGIALLGSKNLLSI